MASSLRIRELCLFQLTLVELGISPCNPTELQGDHSRFTEGVQGQTLKFVSGSSPRHILKFCLLFDRPTPNTYVEHLGRDENFEAHLLCICCKVKSRTSPEGSVILLDQNYASVWNLVEIYSLV